MRSWYHTIDMPDGTATPGFYDTRGSPSFIPWPKKLAGGRCLDVGTFDGFWAFELERRGAAEVIALDLAEPEAHDIERVVLIEPPRFLGALFGELVHRSLNVARG